ncbi:hypothetical protein BJ508DRAFT_314931 [Ascobolus immersus RN42]|uniref:Uncharacterized protein n=1 Tax=Ascobolus immersus RN42 TaxID=1160509 RepID=A0A3N4HHJ0_ASCIM|nr:hypothetical protein BJ508DRAFT_314931 [Ascobolus immersus RN42]
MSNNPFLTPTSNPISTPDNPIPARTGPPFHWAVIDEISRPGSPAQVLGAAELQALARPGSPVQALIEEKHCTSEPLLLKASVSVLRDNLNVQGAGDRVGVLVSVRPNPAFENVFANSAAEEGGGSIDSHH